MSQYCNPNEHEFDLYIFDQSPEPIHYEFEFSSKERKYRSSDEVSLGLGKWYAVVLASPAPKGFIPIAEFFVGGRIVTNGKTAEGDWILLNQGDKAAYVFYVKPTMGEKLLISPFDLVFQLGKNYHDLRYHIPELSFKIDSSRKTHLSFHPSPKRFRFPIKPVPSFSL